jgi:membrane protein implicated in regulation of membrane protease activity
MKMSRTKRLAIGMLIVFGLQSAVYVLLPYPLSMITTAIVVVLVLDWLWNRRKNMEYTQDGNGTYDRQQKSET